MLTQKSPTTYAVSKLDFHDEPLGTYHVSALHLVHSRDTQPLSPLKKRTHETTGCTSDYLQFARELRTIDDSADDLTSAIENDNIIPEITQNVKCFSELSNVIRGRIEKKAGSKKITVSSSQKTVAFLSRS
ncbi:hypothetical protein AVEN_272076-1 [Araneus ventricosus]|uniref:Uncharacterized protein n=1 Tax=Araneus ventricosus TaxID=182803 RepID=A0A4Y2PKI4_ARAVE|nr:hypothetical protein AVEN_272076-1 [Araneus ventricosus]